LHRFRNEAQRLSHGVMVALQFLVLPDQVRVLVRQPINGNRLNFRFEVQPVFVSQKYIVFKKYFCRFAPRKPHVMHVQQSKCAFHTFKRGRKVLSHGVMVAL
jgi:hypothetical protein